MTTTVLIKNTSAEHPHAHDVSVTQIMADGYEHRDIPVKPGAEVIIHVHDGSYFKITETPKPDDIL